jgi:hypothetical protein
MGNVNKYLGIFLAVMEASLMHKADENISRVMKINLDENNNIDRFTQHNPAASNHYNNDCRNNLDTSLDVLKITLRDYTPE